MGRFSFFSRSSKARSDSTEAAANQKQRFTSIENSTGYTLVLRDKFRGQHGRLRHYLGPNAAQSVPTDASGFETYYKMAVMIKLPGDGNEGNTDLLVDTEDLVTCSKISIVSSGDKLSIEKILRTK